MILQNTIERIPVPEVTARNVLFALLSGYLFIFPWLNFKSAVYPLMMQFFWLLPVALLLLITLIICFVTSKLKIPWSPLFWPVLAFTAAKIITSIFSIIPHRSLWGAYSTNPDGLLYLIIVLIIGLTLLSLSLKPKEVVALIWLFLIQSTILSIQVIAEAYSSDLPRLTTRTVTPLLNSDYFLSYACLILPLSVILLWRSWRSLRSMIQIAYITVNVLVLAMAIFFSVPTDLQQKIDHFFHPTQKPTTEQAAPTGSAPIIHSSANEERFTEWRVGFQIGLEHPLLGSGPGTTRAAFYQHAPELPDWNYTVAMDFPHNDFIQQFSQSGIIGLLTYLSIWITLFALYRKHRNRLSSDIRPYAIGLGLGLMLFLLFNMLVFTVIVTGLMISVWVAMLLQMLQMVDWHPVRLAHETAITIVVVTIALATTIGYWNGRYTAGEVTMTRALQHSNSGDFMGAYTLSLQAAALFPWEENYHYLTGGHGMLVLLNQDQTHTLSERERAAIAEESLDQTKTALRLNPDIPDFHVNLGIIEYLTSDQGSSLEKRGADDLLAALKRTPWDRGAYTNVVSTLITKGNRELGLSVFDRLGQQTPSSLHDFLNGERQRFKDTVK